MSNKHNRSTGKAFTSTFILQAAALTILVCAFVFSVIANVSAVPAQPEVTDNLSVKPLPTPGGTVSPDTPESPVVTATPEPEYVFAPYHTENTDPEKFIKTVGIMVNGTQLGEDEEYEAAEPIRFGEPEEYTDMEGIITFRGNNYRDTAAYGTADFTQEKLTGVWSKTTGALTSYNTTWTGSGWTGQPLMVRWPKETKAHMNMYDWAKADDELVELIYATMDGYVYFLDLESGEATRDALNLGYTFKGAGALDPRGYPILYLGSGYDSNLGTSRVFIINLLDCSTMYTFGNNDSFSLRGTLSYFDASPLVDAETDQLIYPGENGILYIIKLNTQYDEEKGELSIEPSDIVKWHYYGKRTSLASYWVGVEGSAAHLQGYIFMADNGGNLMCLDLDTLELVWVQDTLDDTNSTPVLSFEDGHPYIYLGTSYHLGWRSWMTEDAPIWKIDAENGEIVWQVDYNCYSESGVSGGIQSTVALGKNELEDYIYVSVARTPTISEGYLACIDKKTGEEVWKYRSYYTWSSPVIVYDDSGHGNIIYCTYGGTMYMLDGLTGEVHSTFNMGGGAEASPAAYNDMVVIGTRQCKIWGVKIS